MVHAKDDVTSGSGTKDDPYVAPDGTGGIMSAMDSVKEPGPVTVLAAAGVCDIVARQRGLMENVTEYPVLFLM